MIIKGLTIEPFFYVKATDDGYCDTYSLLGFDDGQEALKKLKEYLTDYMLWSNLYE